MDPDVRVDPGDHRNEGGGSWRHLMELVSTQTCVLGSKLTTIVASHLLNPKPSDFVAPVV